MLEFVIENYTQFNSVTSDIENYKNLKLMYGSKLCKIHPHLEACRDDFHIFWSYFLTSFLSVPVHKFLGKNIVDAALVPTFLSAILITCFITI